MDLSNFSAQERQALLDLFVLGMYADGHLASVEDNQGRRLLGEMGYDTVYERNRQFDAAVARTRKHLADPRAHAETLAETFGSEEKRRRILGLLAELLSSDNKVSAEENRFLSVVKEAFGM